MSNLEKLKQKMMIKPKVEEREKVAVVIKRVNNVSKKTNPPIQTNEQKENKEDEERRKDTELNVPIIVDETNKGFDRKTLLDKLKQSKLIKVSMKPVLEKINEKIESVSKKPEEKIKKAKKVTEKNLN